MKGLFHFIEKYHFPIIFVILEIIAFTLFINQHSYQRSRFLNSANRISGALFESYTQVSQYLGLRKANQLLAKENRQFHEFVLNLPGSEPKHSAIEDQYHVFPARVINNSVNLQNNYFTINKGKKDSISPEMAVLAPDGAVGVVKAVSDHYSLCISLLNCKFSLSARLNKSDYFGSLSWDGTNYRFAYLHEIPGHVLLHPGDTIVTSGYSAMFPENIIIGTIDSYQKTQGEYFYLIKVKLAADFKNLRSVYIINNRLKKEQHLLEEEAQND